MYIYIYIYIYNKIHHSKIKKIAVLKIIRPPIVGQSVFVVIVLVLMKHTVKNSWCVMKLLEMIT